LTNATAVMTVMYYALFTSTSGKNLSIVITVPIVLFAIMHFNRLVMLFGHGEEPEHIVMHDLRLNTSQFIGLASVLFGIFMLARP
jgi:hypothetical protein